MTITAVTVILHDENSLREHTGNRLLRAMQADKPLSLLEKALQFSADHCALEAGITANLMPLNRHKARHPLNNAAYAHNETAR